MHEAITVNVSGNGAVFGREKLRQVISVKICIVTFDYKTCLIKSNSFKINRKL